ncbi:hypothetical protein EVAR_87804_1 [Eumeta japonica]|uniref:Uncharacterized protein n=1 Tax=Eumeta variegata TaxID=151549 RepID=A0A4C1X3A7_EUMVA|nr:hypothetical protein EVAR_87804_1 [Eumeta japonica]
MKKSTRQDSSLHSKRLIINQKITGSELVLEAALRSNVERKKIYTRAAAAHGSAPWPANDSCTILSALPNTRRIGRSTRRKAMATVRNVTEVGRLKSSTS